MPKDTVSFAATGLLAGLVILGVSGCGADAGLTAASAGISGKPAQAVAFQAGRQAAKWAADSFLVSAEGYNLDANSRLRNASYSRWDFTFVSVNRVGTLVVTVPGQGKITSTPTAPFYNAVQPLMTGSTWKIDSDKATAVARKALGSSAPDDRIDRISLTPGNSGGHGARAVWQVVPDVSQRPIYVDAMSGTLITP